jgi:methylthioribose-1-phosphate isomerase
MNIQGKAYRTIWLDDKDNQVVKIIDQRLLPHQFIIRDIQSWEEMAIAIQEMWLRGAGLIGAAAAYGIYLASVKAVETENPIEYITHAAHQLEQTRPTAVNLQTASRRMLHHLQLHSQNLISEAKTMAENIANEDALSCKAIGEHGLKIIQELSRKKEGKTLNILTHCNAGWLAFVDYGSALAPVYLAHNSGIKVHVWVDETRPRNQGARLTAWELTEHGVPHTIIADNTGGHLMQNQLVDMVIVGSDRCARNGDVANKIGTYLKALAAKDNHIPFFVALPSSTIDWEISDGLSQIPIEERDASEVKYMSGQNSHGEIEEILVTPQDSPAKNYGFDITPARLISGIITERGVCDANETALLNLFPENKNV